MLVQQNLMGHRQTKVGVSQNYLQAHMWANLAASRLTGSVREQAAKLRDGLAKLLSKSELGRAQRMAEEWRAKTE